jgi:hypothetical protein
LVLGAAFALVLGVASCGGDSDDGAPEVTESFPEDTAETTTTEDPEATDTDDAPTGPAPTEYSGTITVAGATTEVGNDDFAICETVNPAFADDFNIITALSDGTKVRLSGTLDDMDPEFDGLFLGEIPEEEHATDLDISRDGNTISGTATVPAGEVEFSFTC